MNNINAMASSVRLRTATIDDAALLSTLGARLFAQTFEAENTPEDMAAYLAEAFNVERQRAELADPQRWTVIAENASGNAIGYAVLIRGEKGEAIVAERPVELRRIYVDAALHGQLAQGERRGVGHLLLDACVEQAHTWTGDVIWLAVWERNARALRFYEKHGFQRVGKKTFQLGADTQHDFVMARNL
jgi:ribosomal protein S18 acetylase RimI-like enzyme